MDQGPEKREVNNLSQVENKLRELGFELPTPPSPVAAYVHRANEGTWCLFPVKAPMSMASGSTKVR